MNIKSYILGLSALSMVGLSACDTDNVRSIYENATAGITFLAEEQEESFSETATDLSFNVDVVRQNAKGETTVNLISTCMKENESGKLEETTWNGNHTPHFLWKNGGMMLLWRNTPSIDGLMSESRKGTFDDCNWNASRYGTCLERRYAAGDDGRFRHA